MTDFTSMLYPQPPGPSNQQIILTGLTHLSSGRMKEAEQCFRMVQQRDPNPTTNFLLATLLPPVYKSKEDLLAWRKRFTESLRDLAKRNIILKLDEHLAVPAFTTAYHGMDDLSLHRELTRLYQPPTDPPLAPSRKDGKIKVAFISSYFRDHTIGRLNHGLIEKLDRDQFHVTVISTHKHKGQLAEIYRKHADEYVVIGDDINAARKKIANMGLDILFYTDLGMEPITYTLAFSRLAPVQCSTWGHPDTSAIPAIDYFISSEELDTEDAQKSYSEKLARLKLPAVYYHRPSLPANPKTRADFGLPEHATLYGCPQTLIKFHPDFDPVLSAILRGDDDGILVLLKQPFQEMEKTLLERFGHTLPELTHRIRWVDRQDRAGFLSLNNVLDVSLDPLHFGGGNTSYEALALGVPIVTLPSEFLRGRITYAQYRMMGVDDCIVQYPGEYIQKALQLGKDREYRDSVKQKILAANSVLFENGEAVKGLEEFFKQIARG